MAAINKDEIEKLMQEPLPIEASEQESKIKRNLLTGSSIALLICTYNLRLSPDKPIFGIPFENLNTNVLYISLLLFISYEVINFSWIVFNKIAYWRVRLTGTNYEPGRNSAFGYRDTNSPLDFKSALPQSNFYCWMLEREEDAIDNTNALLRLINESCDHISTMYKSGETQQTDLLLKLENDIKTLNEKLNSSSNLIHNIRINASMIRFDKWFNMMLRSQSLRWCIFDFAVPLILGISSWFFLLYKLFLLN